MQHVDLIRRYSIKQVNALRIFISTLPNPDHLALSRLYGVEGVKTAATIADYVLVQLGHCPPEATRMSPTVRAAREIMPDKSAMPDKKARG